MSKPTSLYEALNAFEDQHADRAHLPQDVQLRRAFLSGIEAIVSLSKSVPMDRLRSELASLGRIVGTPLERASLSTTQERTS